MDDHDRHIEIDSVKEKMQSSLGEWYQPEREDSVKGRKKMKKKQVKKLETDGKLAQIREQPMLLSKINLTLLNEHDDEVRSVASRLSNQSRA